MPNTHDNPIYRNTLISFLELNNLIDPWRIQNPEKKMFTWHRGDKRSRLDYIFCSEHLLNVLNEVSILPGIHSDHSLLYIYINSKNKSNRGRGFWKWNSNLIHDSYYVNSIKILSKKNLRSIQWKI